MAVVAPGWSSVDVSLQRARSRPSVPVRLVMVSVAILAVLVATALYFRVGWWRMEAACSHFDVDWAMHNSVFYEWDPEMELSRREQAPLASWEMRCWGSESQRAVEI